jgi:hypothetical protein
MRTPASSLWRGLHPYTSRQSKKCTTLLTWRRCFWTARKPGMESSSRASEELRGGYAPSEPYKIATPRLLVNFSIYLSWALWLNWLRLGLFADNAIHRRHDVYHCSPRVGAPATSTARLSHCFNRQVRHTSRPKDARGSFAGYDPTIVPTIPFRQGRQVIE